MLCLIQQWPCATVDYHGTTDDDHGATVDYHAATIDSHGDDGVNDNDCDDGVLFCCTRMKTLVCDSASRTLNSCTDGKQMHG